MDWSFTEQRSRCHLQRFALLALLAAAATSCTSSHEPAADIDPGSPELAALMKDGKLPAEMVPPPPTTPPPPLPPRFCSDPTQELDGGVLEPGAAGVPAPIPRPRPGRGVIVAGSGAAPAPDDGTEVDEEAPIDPACGRIPVGFWRFDDCNTFRTELGDSSFESHTAFRTVDLTCAAGQEGLAASFAKTDDLVYVPDQPSYALDRGVTVAAWVRPDALGGVQTIFRKRDDGNSAFALILNGQRFQFIVRLANGRLASVSTPASAGRWTHLAATYDGKYARLYVDGREAAQTAAEGVIIRGVGPLLMGNDGSGRRFAGRLDNAWFNTQAAPPDAVVELTCLRSDPTMVVSPEVGPAVPAGTAVDYAMAITNQNDASCAPLSLFVSISPELFDFTVEPSFIESVALASGETRSFDVVVRSSEDVESGSYAISFSAFVQDNFGGPVGPPVFRGGPTIGIAPAPGASAASPVAEDEPARPAPTGFVQVQAQYVVAEPTGCHVSSQRTLMIRDLSVVEDPIRTTLTGSADDPRTGVWTFAHLMEQIAPTPEQAADVTEGMFRTFLTPQTVNGFAIPVRTPMESLVLEPWPRTAEGKLDLTRAPMRLLAITHRLDLDDAASGKAGEGRLTFGVLDPTGFTLEFTVIFEYLLPAADASELLDWRESVHTLQELPFPSEEYNQALQELTARFTSRGAVPGLPNGSALIDVRTNELSLSQDGQWQLREFRIHPESGFLTPFPVFQTPDAAFNFGEALGRFVNANEDIILTERHEVPLLFEDLPFGGAAVFNNIDFWDAPGITNPEARHKFSLNTCNGCHGAETQTPFLHINPRLPGEQSRLSAFLTGTTVFDPIDGTERRLRELARRRELLESVVCAGEP